MAGGSHQARVALLRAKHNTTPAEPKKTVVHKKSVPGTNRFRVRHDKGRATLWYYLDDGKLVQTPLENSATMLTEDDIVRLFPEHEYIVR